MAAGPVFPGFIRVEYQTDGSAKSKFLAEAAQLSGEVKKPFSEAFDQIGKMVDRVSGKLKNGQFSLDVDVSGLRVASAQADFTMKKVQALRDAAIQMATSSRDGSASTKAFVTALQAQAAQAEKNALIVRDQVAAYANLQNSVSSLTQGNNGLADSYRALMAEQSRAAAASNTAKYQAEALKVQEQQRNELLRLRAAADQLRGSLDPTVTVQQRYNAELEKVGQLLKARVIDQELYTKAVEKAARARASELDAIKAANAVPVEARPANALPQNTNFGLQGVLSDKRPLDAAIAATVTLEGVLGRVANKGREVSAALAQADLLAAGAAKERAIAEAEKLAASEKAQAAATAELQRMAQAAESLNARLNPAVAIQQRFNNEIEQARKLLAAGVIDQRLYGQAVEQANRDQAASLKLLAAAQDQASASAKRGTSETQNVINGLRAQRVAGIQAGQQLQDMAVQFQMGTNASTIMAQQLPQLAFALSGLENNANKTLSKIGSFATFLSGPWGAAIAIGLVALGPFIDELYKTLTAADDATEALQKFINKQREISAGALEETQAMIGLNKARSELLEIDLKLAKRPKGPDGTPLFSFKDLQRRKELTFQVIEAEGALDAAEAKREAAAKARTSTTRTPRSSPVASGRAPSFAGLEFGEDAAKRIANIADGFRDIPPEVERINRATRELDDIISDLENRKPVGFEASIKEAEALKAALPDAAFQQIMRQITDETKQQTAVQGLLSQGRYAEADALQKIYQIEGRLGPLTADRKAEILAISQAQEEVNRHLERANEIQSAYLDATRAVRGEVQAILGGYGKLGDLGATLRRSFQNIKGAVLTEQIFGDVFRDMDRYVKEKTGIGSSVDLLKTETERAGTAASQFADTLVNATRTIMGGGSAAGGIVAGASAASAWGNMQIPDSIRLPGYDLDPNGPLVAAGAVKKDGKRTITDLSPEEFFYQMGQKVGARWAEILEPLLGKNLAGNIGGVIGGVFEGRATTGTGFGAILGGLKEIKGLPKGITEALGGAFKGAQAGDQVAGLGNALGVKMSNTGAQIGGAIGSFIPIPGGDIIGSIAGGLLGSLFGKKVTSGYAQVRGGTVAGTYGRTGDLQNDAREAAGGLVDTISSLAKTLGTSLGYYEFDYGKKNDKFVVNTGGGGLGTLEFADEQEAMAFAVRNAVSDGAFVGIKDAQKRLLLASGDLQAQAEKAVKFGDVFKQLRAFKDPVGAAVDELNTEFQGLIDIFKEAGASSAEYAGLEELYGIRRAAAIDEANQKIFGSMKDFYKSLTVGNDTLSLRDRNSAALAAFNPLADRVRAGDTTAYDGFVTASQDLLAIQRELYGSTSAFFALQDSITALTSKTIADQTAISDAGAASDSPFAQLAAQGNATVSAIESQTAAIVAALGGYNANLIAAIQSQAVNSNGYSDLTALLSARGDW